MTKEQKQADLMNKRLGLGDYSVGGTKSIREHDDERYADEALEMEMIGFQRYAPPSGGATYDMFGISWDRGDENERVGNEFDQMREDDY
jgi:hypothetical protein